MVITAGEGNPTGGIPVICFDCWRTRSTRSRVPYSSTATGTGLSEYEFGQSVWTEFIVFPYPIAFSGALSRFSA